MGIEADRSDTGTGTDEAVKASADALHRIYCGDYAYSTHELRGDRASHESDARAVLDAALPHILRPIHRTISEHAAAHQRDYPDPDQLSIAVRNRAAGYQHALRYTLDVITAAARTNADLDIERTGTFRHRNTHADVAFSRRTIDIPVID